MDSQKSYKIDYIITNTPSQPTRTHSSYYVEIQNQANDTNLPTQFILYSHNSQINTSRKTIGCTYILLRKTHYNIQFYAIRSLVRIWKVQLFSSNSY